MLSFVRTFRQAQRSTGPKSQMGEFRVLQLTQSKGSRSGPMKKRAKPKFKEVPPPRYLRMSTDQDWTNVWPTATTFKQSVVPLPITQGYVSSDKENKGLPVEKYANAELMKIPNFFHLTPNHIKKHCAAIKKYCTPWPEELNSDEACEYYLPIQITTYDYLNSTPSIRDSRARVVKFNFKLTQLEFDEHARDKFIRLAGQRYNADTDELTLVADKCPYRKQNYDYAQYLLTALYFESWKAENWEQDRTKNDWQTYYWDKSPSRTRLLDILKASEKNASSVDSKSIVEQNKKLVERYRTSITRVQDEGVENELKNLTDYKNDIIVFMSSSNLDKLVSTQYGWHVDFDKEFDSSWKPFSRPRFSQLIEYVPLFLRYLRVWYALKREKRRAHMDFINPVPLQQIYGAPIGGLGCGTIGRGFKGEFCRYQLVPGLYEFYTVETNTFTVCIRRRHATTYCQVLTTNRLRKKGLHSWNSAFPKENGHYQALYPQSWTTYNLPGQNLRLLCKQLSPFIPDDYKDASLPVASFVWYIENLDDEPVEVSIMFTWQAGSASNEFECKDISHESIHISNDDISATGISIKQKLREMSLEYCILGKKESDNIITTRTNFNVDSEIEGRNVWLDLTDDGRLTEDESQNSSIATLSTASSVCITTTVEPKSIKSSEFALAWHMPEIKFGLGQKIYSKWYTKWFDKATLNGTVLCLHTMNNRLKWEDAITKWQKPVLDDASLPDWYKSALFNESYFVADGGSIWLDVSEDTTLPEHVRSWGRFGYLEGHEYRMINTYDVHFYASFALIQLWPQLELSIQYDYATSIAFEKLESRVYLFHGQSGIWKTLNSVPHDLGDPDEEPWLFINAYIAHDTADWKDLGPKYVLQVYRDYIYTQNKQFLTDIWPTIKLVMNRLKTQDTDGDGLIDNGGFADQTYDAWTVAGASAYCGGLHIAALRASLEMARLMDDTSLVDEYEVWLQLAKKSYSEKLWNGQYYDYDSSMSFQHDSIMSDQLAGFWYLRLSGHKYEDFEKDRVDSILTKIFKTNVMEFGNGKLGAVNGMTKTGKLETVSIQSEEVWTGVTYGLSSTMIMENLENEAFVTSEGIYNTCYNIAGLAFQTPEALTRENRFRSCGYMRALSIWAIQKAIELSRTEANRNKDQV
ncbi:unnamed protein product [Rotaria sp. Silwood1]|nr:unnamed protein product [Rotaria sp. Silwood1]CAF4506224.1 unnamed protein product [Rotaria sp. Silwood1]